MFMFSFFLNSFLEKGDRSVRRLATFECFLCFLSMAKREDWSVLKPTFWPVLPMLEKKGT